MESKIRESIINIIKEITEYQFDVKDFEHEKKALYYIISHSIRATKFVILIEDEFEIEFEDDVLNMDFFSGIDKIVESVIAQKQNEKV